MRIKDVSSALVAFEDAAIKQAKATEEGDYKTGNKNYNRIGKAVIFLNTNNALSELLKFLNHNEVGVRIWSACVLIFIYEEECVRILTDESKNRGIHASNARTFLEEWKKGKIIPLLGFK